MLVLLWQGKDLDAILPYVKRRNLVGLDLEHLGRRVWINEGLLGQRQPLTRAVAVFVGIAWLWLVRPRLMPTKTFCGSLEGITFRRGSGVGDQK
jgi:hypothetical protein